MTPTVRDLDPRRDVPWAESLLDRDFGGRVQARRGVLRDVLALPGLVAERDGRPVGVLTYRVEAGACEIAWIAATERRTGVGTALLAALRERVAPSCSRLWLVTTNDAEDARRFYEARGFVVSAVRPGAVDEARRRLKPSIPSRGEGGVPIRDEVEWELSLAGRAGRTFLV